MFLLGTGPVGYSETLKDSAWKSVEFLITDTFKESLRVEILSVNMIVNVWLLVEFVFMNILNAEAYIILN